MAMYFCEVLHEVNYRTCISCAPLSCTVYSTVPLLNGLALKRAMGDREQLDSTLKVLR
jgi:hypothetical protein